MIKVAVVDDHHFVRTGIALHFERQPDIVVTTCVAAAACLDADPRFDILLLDLYLTAEGPAIDVITHWSPVKPVLVMSYSGRSADVVSAVRAGASGYLTKDTSEDRVRHSRARGRGRRVRLVGEPGRARGADASRFAGK